MAVLVFLRQAQQGLARAAMPKANTGPRSKWNTPEKDDRRHRDQRNCKRENGEPNATHNRCEPDDMQVPGQSGRFPSEVE
jgi:hypothetical protein